MVLPAPRIESVLPVVPGVRRRRRRRRPQRALRPRLPPGGPAPSRVPRLANRFTDTCQLARRLVRDEVANCKLSTLADHFRVKHRPTHRALDDALATGEVLHCLLERAGSLGVLALEDLLDLPTVARPSPVGEAQAAPTTCPANRACTSSATPGGGRCTSARPSISGGGSAAISPATSGARSASSCGRRTPSTMSCARATLEASVLEVRLIHQWMPRFNRQGKHWRHYAYVKLTLDERFPRLSIVRQPKADDGCLYIGPLASSRRGEARGGGHRDGGAAAALHQAGAEGLRSAAGRALPRSSGCRRARARATSARPGIAAIVDQVVAGLTTDPRLLLGPIEQRMRALAGAARYEEAAGDPRPGGGAVAGDRPAASAGRVATGRAAAGRGPGRGRGGGRRGRLVAAWTGEHGQLGLAPQGAGGPDDAGAVDGADSGAGRTACRSPGIWPTRCTRWPRGSTARRRASGWSVATASCARPSPGSRATSPARRRHDAAQHGTQHRKSGDHPGATLRDMLHAFVLIDAEPARIADLATELTEVEGVAEVYSVAGQDADIVAIVRVRQHEDLADVVTRTHRGLVRHSRHSHAGCVQGLQPPRPGGDVGPRRRLTSRLAS